MLEKIWQALLLPNGHVPLDRYSYPNCKHMTYINSMSFIGICQDLTVLNTY